jgi:hypothetical protein
MDLNAGFVALAVNFVVTVAVSLVTATSPAVGPAEAASGLRTPPVDVLRRLQRRMLLGSGGARQPRPLGVDQQLVVPKSGQIPHRVRIQNHALTIGR